MKSVYSSLLLAIVFLFTSCSEKVTVEPEIFFEFKGEKVRIPEAFPTELFDQSPENFRNYYTAMMARSGARPSGEGNSVMITYQELKEIIEKHKVKYPWVNYEDEITDQDVKRISKDFPEITTKQQVKDKMEIIFEYYNILLKNDVVPEAVRLESDKKKKGRVLAISPGNLTEPEKQILLNHPAMAASYITAAQDANVFTLSMWGTENENEKNNAFKHAIWNCLSIRYILASTPSSETNAINFTQNGTAAHEKDNSGVQKREKEQAMDLHNNMAARVWMSNEVGWGFMGVRKMPSVTKILETMMNKANNATFHDSSEDSIMAMHGGNNDTSWNNLYNNLYGPYEHLVYLTNSVN